MQFLFSPATPADDADLRRLLTNNPVSGSLTMTYEREPNYFLGNDVLGDFAQTITVRHPTTGALAAAMTRSVRRLYVNGQVESVGYLSQWRVDKQFQGLWILPQGMRQLRHLHADGRTQGYLATIIEGGRQATGLLVERARRNYINFRPAGQLVTLALILRRSKSLPDGVGQVEQGSLAALPEIIDFLQRHGPRRQFFPVYTAADFAGGSPRVRDFRIEDFVLVRRHGKLAGVMGLWNQHGFKQSVVQGYSGSMAGLRPLYNLGLRLLGAASLPAPGQPLRYAYAPFTCVANDNRAVFNLLLRHTCNLAGQRGFAHLMLGLTVSDPLLRVARRYLHVPYRSQLYTVAWPADEAWHHRLDGRPPYLEIAAM